MRPVSVDELISRRSGEDSKPKFLSKSQRQKLALLKREKEVARKKAPAEHTRKRQIEEIDVGPEEESSEVAQSNNESKKKKKRENGKFSFEWKAEDDTSNDYKPMVTYNHSKQTQMHKTDWNDKHWTEKPLDKMKERDWRILKEDYNISSKGGLVDNPLRSWEESTIPKQIIDIIYSVGYNEPTPIQRAAIPCALNNRDIVGIAETGSGKTASFLIPLLTYITTLPPIDDRNKNDGPYGLVIAPTRELAQQIEKEAKKFCSELGFHVTSIVGGHSFEETVHNIRDGIHIVIATPGRLVDSLERHILSLDQCYYLIMDEADRMIDMGFEAQVSRILESLPPIETNPFGLSKRQTMMFTATMPPAIEKITKNFLIKPASLMIGNVGDASDSVVQEVEFINNEDKRKTRMIELLSSRRFKPPVIIFVNYKKTCDMVSKELTYHGFRNSILHGSKSQEQRELSLNQLRNGKVDVLVATDLAGRGIDIPSVSLVLNFQMSKNIEDYTHRIGRTGRAGLTGTAITFVGEDDAPVFYNLKKIMMKSTVSKIPNELRVHPAARLNTFKE